MHGSRARCSRRHARPGPPAPTPPRGPSSACRRPGCRTRRVESTGLECYRLVPPSPVGRCHSGISWEGDDAGRIPRPRKVRCHDDAHAGCAADDLGLPAGAGVGADAAGAAAPLAAASKAAPEALPRDTPRTAPRAGRPSPPPRTGRLPSTARSSSCWRQTGTRGLPSSSPLPPIPTPRWPRAAAVRPGVRRSLRLATPGPGRDGWDEQRFYSYETSPNERRAVRELGKPEKVDGDTTFNVRVEHQTAHDPAHGRPGRRRQARLGHAGDEGLSGVQARRRGHHEPSARQASLVRVYRLAAAGLRMAPRVPKRDPGLGHANPRRHAADDEVRRTPTRRRDSTSSARIPRPVRCR